MLVLVLVLVPVLVLVLVRGRGLLRGACRHKGSEGDAALHLARGRAVLHH